MTRKAILFLALFIGSFLQTYAHAFWLETSASGKKGKAQEIRVYFGEYADKDITPVKDWFSNTKDYTLILITPDKKQVKLTSTAAADHFKANFTPDQEGVYTVVLQHRVKDIYNGSLLDYHSSAAVKVGAATAGDHPEQNTNAVSIYSTAKDTYKANAPISLQAFFDKLPAGEKEVEVVAPNGWGKKLYTDSTGKASFTPIWPGRYMIEVANTENKSGEHEGKAYEKNWRCATYCIEVIK